MNSVKFFSRFTICILVSVFLFTNCGDDNGTEPSGSELIGTWEMTKITAEISGVSMSGTPEEAVGRFV